MHKHRESEWAAANEWMSRLVQDRPLLISRCAAGVQKKEDIICTLWLCERASEECATGKNARLSAALSLARSLGAARNCKNDRKNVFPCLVTGTRAQRTEFILITTETAAKRPGRNKRCNSTTIYRLPLCRLGERTWTLFCCLVLFRWSFSAHLVSKAFYLTTAKVTWMADSSAESWEVQIN